MKIYAAGTHQKRLAEALLMSTRNICFCGENYFLICLFEKASVLEYLSGKSSHRCVNIIGYHQFTYKHLVETLNLHLSVANLNSNPFPVL